MSHAREQVFTYLNLSDFLRLNFLEQMTLNDIKNHKFDELKFFSTSKSLADVGFIIKMAHASPDFASMCKKDNHTQLWNDLYSQLGLVVSFFEKKQMVFYEHQSIDSFDLLRGTYFFYLSQQVKAAFSDKFSSSEARLLKEAMRFNSVHAVQRYNTFLYNKVANEKLEGGENANELLMEAIKNINSKPFLELHGSYAYMLLAEAYYHYALWAKNHEDKSTFFKAMKAAITACDMASKYLEKSQFSIFNASFGNGLGFSNSFDADSPEEAKTKLKDLLEQSLQENVSASRIVPR